MNWVIAISCLLTIPGPCTWRICFAFRRFRFSVRLNRNARGHWVRGIGFFGITSNAVPVSCGNARSIFVAWTRSRALRWSPELNKCWQDAARRRSPSAGWIEQSSQSGSNLNARLGSQAASINIASEARSRSHVYGRQQTIPLNVAFRRVFANHWPV